MPRAHPVAPAQRSDAARARAAHQTLEDGTPAHSIPTLMAELATLVRSTCRTPGAALDGPTFDVVTRPNAKQRRALDLIQQMQP